ncbi:MAG: NAD(P)/FAD-dependent oxidoreductase [Arachnia propionica]|uniref:NAD(P)/FAD-dependent oxidoreductase n=1 Tax=Arachnia propionica TaxID=1750 RepID=UPI0027041F55|nr:NAD(P)/FAD-dependent oxidoreductase [Arachnia propionica]
MEEHIDVIVIGAGAAGLSAALLLARSRRRVVVVDAGEPRNAPAQRMRGFLSNDGLSPREFLTRGRAEMVAHGATILDDRVVSVGDDRTVHLASGRSLQARRVLVATGAVDVLPPLPGIAERWGRDVLHCPYCHAYEVAERDFAVLGVTPGAVHHALLLRQWSERVTLFSHTQQVSDEQRAMLDARGVRIVEGEVEGVVVEDDMVRAVRVAGVVHPCEVVFLPPGMRPRDEFLTGLGCERDDRGFLRVDEYWRTSVSWVYAAGNSTDPRAQVITAAGQGSSAGFAMNHDLTMEDVALAVAADTGDVTTPA